MGNTKRILSIEVKHEHDTNPDTSYLGSYSDTRESEFSINRRHTPDCPMVSQAVADALGVVERAIKHLEDARGEQYLLSPYPAEPTALYSAFGDAQDILIQAQEDMTECNCGGGEVSRHEYTYFNPSSNYVDGDNLKDGLTADEVRRYVARDYELMESLLAGQWYYMGIRAEAEIVVDGISQRVSSGGLWGIESDSDDSYIEEIEAEQLAELRSVLYTLGFSKRAIAKAVLDAEVAA